MENDENVSRFLATSTPRPGSGSAPLREFNMTVIASSQQMNMTSTATNNGDDDYSWLTKDRDRRGDRRFRRFSDSLQGVRVAFNLTSKAHPDFNLAVQEVINWYNKGLPETMVPIDTSIRPDIWGVISELLARHCYNHKFYVSHPDAHPVKAATGKRLKSSSGDGPKQKAKPALADASTNTDGDADVRARQSLPLLLVDFNDYVMVMGTNTREILASGIVTKPLTRDQDDNIDYTVVEIQIVSAPSSMYEKGQRIIIDTIQLIRYPTPSLDHFIADIQPKCWGNHLCELASGDLVLLDLDQKYRNDWPLLAKVSEIAGDNMKVQWLWVSGNLTSNIMNGSFDLWKDRNTGKVFEDLVAVGSHYFCKFHLVNKKLPACAKAACKERIDDQEDKGTF